jgi:hypothetical protein
MTTPTDTAASISPMLANWRITSGDDETHPEVRWEVRAVFDHDYTWHILVQQWRWNGHHFAMAGYSMWYIGLEETAIFVKEWPKADRAPLLDAAAQVMLWEKMLAEVTNQ